MPPPPSLQDLIDAVHRDAPSDNALDQLVTAAGTVARLEEASDALLGHFVDRCRRAGRSWSEISAALGVTKQAVHKRFAAELAERIIAAVPAPTLERFTSRARGVLTEAARAAGQRAVGSAHILQALFAEPEGIAAQALAAMGVTRQAIEAASQAMAAGPPAPGTAASTSADDKDKTAKRFTPDGRRTLRSALEVALEFGHNYIGTEHLLLALYRDAGAPAAVILADAGTSEQQARAHVTELIRGQQA